MKITEQTNKTLEQLESSFRIIGKATLGGSPTAVIEIVDNTTGTTYVKYETSNETGATEAGLEKAVEMAKVTPKPLTPSQKILGDDVSKKLASQEAELAKLKAELEEAKKVKK